MLLVLEPQKTLIHGPLLLSFYMPFEKELELPELRWRRHLLGSFQQLQQASDRAEPETKRVMKKVYFMAASSLPQSEQLFLHCPQSSDRQRAESHATLPSI